MENLKFFARHSLHAGQYNQFGICHLCEYSWTEHPDKMRELRKNIWKELCLHKTSKYDTTRGVEVCVDCDGFVKT